MFEDNTLKQEEKMRAPETDVTALPAALLVQGDQGMLLMCPLNSYQELW